MENISAIIESYEELIDWLYESDYMEWITSDGMFFEVKNNNIPDEVDILLVENYNVRYISSSNSIYFFNEEYHISIDDDSVKQLIELGYQLNN